MTNFEGGEASGAKKTDFGKMVFIDPEKIDFGAIENQLSRPGEITEGVAALEYIELGGPSTYEVIARFVEQNPEVFNPGEEQ